MNIDIRRNLGIKDRTVRATIASILAAGYYAEVYEGWLHTWCIVVAVDMLLTCLLGYSVLYVPFKLNTKERLPDGTYLEM